MHTPIGMVAHADAQPAKGHLAPGRVIEGGTGTLRVLFDGFDPADSVTVTLIDPDSTVSIVDESGNPIQGTPDPNHRNLMAYPLAFQMVGSDSTLYDLAFLKFQALAPTDKQIAVFFMDKDGNNPNNLRAEVEIWPKKHGGLVRRRIKR